MSTVDKVTADRIVAGEFPEDGATRIVEYTDMGGKLAYGVTFERDDQNKYLHSSPFIGNPSIYWEAP